MLAVIKGITVTGTPEEIAALIKLNTEQPVERTDKAMERMLKEYDFPLKSSGYTKPQMDIIPRPKANPARVR